MDDDDCYDSSTISDGSIDSIGSIMSMTLVNDEHEEPEDGESPSAAERQAALRILAWFKRQHPPSASSWILV